jgi:uncharacterized protein (TIGR03382 family)
MNANCVRLPFCGARRDSTKRVGLIAIGCVAASLFAADIRQARGEIAFGIRPSYNNVPDLANPGAFDPDVVIYSLPASGSVYAGRATSYFDVFARVNGSGTQHAAGFGVILVLQDSGQAMFELAPLPPSGTPNNVPDSKNPDFTQNTFLNDVILGDTNVPGFPPGDRTAGVIGLYVVANANAPVVNGEGLFALPFSIAAGFHGTVGVNFDNNAEYTGFSMANGTIVTNPAVFPHLNGTIEVRQAVRGDFNGDLVADVNDWAGFNAARSNLVDFQLQYPWLPTLYAGDFNEDGQINSADVPAFTELVGVPEPGSITLAIAAAGMLWIVRRRRN